MSRDFQQRLKSGLSTTAMSEPSQAHLDETIRLSRLAYASRRKMRRISTLEMITSQIQFVARSVWILQGFVLLCLCVVMGASMASEQFANTLPAFVSVSAVFVSMTALPFYGRSRRYKMREVESTTRISHPRLMLAKLCVVGIGDVVCLAVITLFTFGKMTAPAQTILMFILLPFLLSCTVSLFIRNCIKEEHGIYISAGLCIGIGVIYWTMATRLQPVLMKLSIGLSIAICMLLILALVFECRRLLRQIPSSDLQEALMY